LILPAGSPPAHTNIDDLPTQPQPPSMKWNFSTRIFAGLMIAFQDARACCGIASPSEHSSVARQSHHFG